VLCRSNSRRVETPRADPAPEPRPEPLGLTLALHEGGVAADWTACGVDGFDAYKLVRSTDPTVSWPMGEHDSLAGVTEDATAFLDHDAPAGKTLYYRVFCVDRVGDGYRVLRSSAVKHITTPAEDPGPKPEPTVIDLELGATDGGVALHWDACPSDAFHWYKIVRSASPNPSYLPATDGSVVVGVIEDPSVREFVDTTAEPGHWFYRVQAIGYWNDQKVVLCQTTVHDVTVG
jgi:hypothetical protein